MAAKHSKRRPASKSGQPSAGRSSAGQPSAGPAPAGGGRPANRGSDRALHRASTGGGSGGPDPLLVWSLVFIFVAAVVVGAALVLTRGGGGGTTAVKPPTVVTPANIPSNGRTLGQANAPVTVDIYGDFRCSACFGFTTGGTEASLVSNYIATGKAKLVWHDLLSIDLRDGSGASRDAANAAWCAADQGKFWTMHDWLYANDESPTEAASAFTSTRLSEIAKDAGLDMTAYQTCFDAGTHNADIAAEQSTTPSQAAGTPSIFVDGKFVGTTDYVATYQQISAAIDAALASPAPSATPGAS